MKTRTAFLGLLSATLGLAAMAPASAMGAGSGDGAGWIEPVALESEAPLGIASSVGLAEAFSVSAPQVYPGGPSPWWACQNRYWLDPFGYWLYCSPWPYSYYGFYGGGYGWGAFPAHYHPWTVPYGGWYGGAGWGPNFGVSVGWSSGWGWGWGVNVSVGWGYGHPGYGWGYAPGWGYGGWYDYGYGYGYGYYPVRAVNYPRGLPRPTYVGGPGPSPLYAATRYKENAKVRRGEGSAVATRTGQPSSASPSKRVIMSPGDRVQGTPGRVSRMGAAPGSAVATRAIGRPSAILGDRGPGGVGVTSVPRGSNGQGAASSRAGNARPSSGARPTTGVRPSNGAPSVTGIRPTSGARPTVDARSARTLPPNGAPSRFAPGRDPAARTPSARASSSGRPTAGMITGSTPTRVAPSRALQSARPPASATGARTPASTSRFRTSLPGIQDMLSRFRKSGSSVGSPGSSARVRSSSPARAPSRPSAARGAPPRSAPKARPPSRGSGGAGVRPPPKGGGS